ncbi:predicted protein [Botrytis cinerea T4]|uniref:Uncharacterized protein n=1 Tax=Botryotinia fuckeliana (strain T4) TaxID=999810 RepID=G2XTN2_BOTF4|nr:predicted protein [Botrytis cinerea T4]
MLFPTLPVAPPSIKRRERPQLVPENHDRGTSIPQWELIKYFDARCEE